MKQTKPGLSGAHDAGNLFRGVALARHRTLILPRILGEEAFRISNRKEDLAAAHAVFVRWGDLESNGHLQGNETSLDEPFRQEIFGKALRYLTVTTAPNAYYYDKKCHVPGVGTPDGVLGNFPPVEPARVGAVIELKDASTDLDHDKFNGRTPVQQCWDYLNNLPNCQWAIVSNFVSFRLYHRDKTQQAFEHFELQKLRDPEEFARFYTLFERDGLLATKYIKVPRAIDLMQRTQDRQREVGDELYNYYSQQRIRLIEHLIANHGRTPDQAIRAAQKLLDRIIFVAFCEDRGLLPRKLIESTWGAAHPLAQVTNPRWQSFLVTFRAIDTGHVNLDLSTGYNGGLFRKDPQVDDLNLEDSWTDIFRRIGEYDFAEDVNVDVLGHIFEKSVSEIEKIRTTRAFFAAAPDSAPTMPKSAERKRFGIYYTPPAFTRFIVQHTVGAVIAERFTALAKSCDVNPETSMRVPASAQLADYWEKCLDAMRQIAIVDPACGSGAFLIAAYELLEEEYQTVVEHLAHHTGKPASAWADAIPEMILTENLHGVDLSKEAVEITQTALWIRSARKGRRLDDLSGNIIVGNSLVTDKAVHPDAMTWQETFPNIFKRPGGGGFDCVIGNPPWERLNLKNREFFAFAAPEVLEAGDAAMQRAIIAKLAKSRPELHQQYLEASERAARVIAHVRGSGRFPLTARGDINTYMVFAELARAIVRATGRVGLLVPSGIATDDTTKAFFSDLMQMESLVALYDFENRRKIFPDVDGRFKFSVLLLGGTDQKTSRADFVSFAHEIRDLAHNDRHIALSKKDLAMLNPNTLTCPVFRTRRDAQLTKSVYRRVPVLIDEARRSGGNPWELSFMLMFHQSFAAEKFNNGDKLANEGYRLVGNRFVNQDRVYLPLYEAKMLQAYDHRAAGVEVDTMNWMRQGQTVETTPVEHQNPEFVVQPRWWIDEAEVTRVLEGYDDQKIIAFKNVTSPTNQRTMIACFIPPAGVVHSAPIMLTGTKVSAKRTCCLLANLNSLIYDYITRQKIGGVNLSYFIINQTPTLPPDAYDDKCPWDKKQTLEKWISDRVLKLTCTANDMLPLAEAAGFKEGVHNWKEGERAEFRAELDAAYFHLYGINREDAQYILSTFQGMTDGDEGTFAPSSAASRILEAFDALAPH